MDDMNFLHQSFDGSSVMNFPPIIIVEDDKLLGLSLKKYLEQTLKLNVQLYSSSEDCLMNFAKHHPKESPFCLVTDISLEQGSDGLLLIDILKDKGFEFVSIVMTGFASIETAIAATKKGVFHYLTKPFEIENLKKLVIQALQTKLSTVLPREIVSEGEGVFAAGDRSKATSKLKIDRPTVEDTFEGMIGRSKAMRDVFDRIQKVAKTDSTILIMGPSGTGKELVASAIHKLSSRNLRNRVSVNCGAIPSELLESELFGHVKGAFTGAISNRKGRFELAQNGTIFLDEIGDMPQLLQVKLLRVLQERQIEPVGSSENIDIDVRVIAATHRDLEKAVAEGKFREDLFYRLNVIPIKMPALKERREDIPLLISHFLDRFVSADRSNEISFAPLTMDLLMGYDWPGNVRELENVIERLVILRGGNEILPEDLPAKIFRSNPLATHQYKTLFELPEVGVDLKQILSDIEDSLIMQAMNRTRGNKNQASKLLALNRTTLIEKMKKKNLEL
ncbi:sigma-54-dependent transcriptional regulator [Peredibacter sp. HCB2-198]|uniref:sigma-54-dependent transcriptional regulator n=1 Tax=Peredibacter sp. HCB2-198 TaxID=3383025 RepID=UPI0038B5D9B3